VQVDHVRHHGGADDADREQDRLAPGELRDEQAVHRAGRRRVAPEQVEAEREHDHGHEAGDRRLKTPEPPDLQAEDGERGHAGQQPGDPHGQPEDHVQAEGRADELGQVGRHRDRLGLQPQQHHGAEREPVAADLGQAPAGGDAQLGAQRLDEHGHQVGRQHHPQQRVAEL
jgi:hypothetical protein